MQDSRFSKGMQLQVSGAWASAVFRSLFPAEFRFRSIVSAGTKKLSVFALNGERAMRTENPKPLGSKPSASAESSEPPKGLQL